MSSNDYSIGLAGDGQPIGISVNGEGRASGTPDVAILILGVATRGATVQAANAQAQEAAGKLLATLRANGIAEKDVRTLQFSISPEFERGKSPESVTARVAPAYHRC